MVCSAAKKSAMLKQRTCPVLTSSLRTEIAKEIHATSMVFHGAILDALTRLTAMAAQLKKNAIATTREIKALPSTSKQLLAVTQWL